MTFKDMRSQTEEEFSNTLKESCLSVWMDTQSSFGTFPLESMASNCPVVGLVPDIKPTWMDENNGIWTKDGDKLIDMIADYIQNWIEDNISEKLYEDGLSTSSKYQDLSNFNRKVVELFTTYLTSRAENFSQQLNKFNIEA